MIKYLIIMLLISKNTYSSISVFDIKGYAKQSERATWTQQQDGKKISEFIKQSNQLVSTVNNLKTQIEQLDTQIDAMTINLQRGTNFDEISRQLASVVGGV